MQFKLCLSFEVLFLELRNEIVFQFDLLKALVVTRISHSGLVSVNLLILLEFQILLVELLHGDGI